MKKEMVFTLLFLIFCGSIYAQQTERITYYDFNENRHITINKAFFVGNIQTYRTVSNPGSASPKLLAYMSLCLFDSNTGKWGEWSGWELGSTMPLQAYENGSVLTTICGIKIGQLQREGTCGEQSRIIDGWKIVQILTKPTGSSSPIWFDAKGYLNEFYNVYAILD
jgi:hypothetical protein